MKVPLRFLSGLDARDLSTSASIGEDGISIVAHLDQRWGNYSCVKVSISVDNKRLRAADYQASVAALAAEIANALLARAPTDDIIDPDEVEE